jgi:carotenoid cleavage dioxygenase
MIHDAAITKNYLIMPLTPIKVDKERLKRGGNHFAWDPDEDQWFGIVPRRGGKKEDIVWLKADNGMWTAPLVTFYILTMHSYPGFHGHIAGSYELPDGKLVVDLTTASDNVFFFFPPDTAAGQPITQPTIAQRQKLVSDTYRWIFDPSTPTGTRVTPHKLFGLNGEFSRVDDRYLTHEYNHFWQLQIDPSRPYDFAKCGPPAGGLFNVLGHFDWREPDKKDDVFWAGPICTFQEPCFVPKEGGTKEGEGYIIALLNHLDVLRNDILIFDALEIKKGPLAVLHLPVKLRLGLHGNFIPAAELEEWTERRKEEPVKAAEGLLPWQKEMEERGELGGLVGR